MGIFADVIGFEWDDGNRDKNLIKHGVSNEECEQVFEDVRRQFYPDIQHSRHEERFVIVGATKSGKLLRIAFTSRSDLIRVISARPINRKEKKLYG